MRMLHRPYRDLLASAGLILLSGRAGAQMGGSADWVPQVLGTQITVIAQRLGRFNAPYSGPMSLVADGDRAVSHTYGIYIIIIERTSAECAAVECPFA